MENVEYPKKETSLSAQSAEKLEVSSDMVGVLDFNKVVNRNW